MQVDALYVTYPLPQRKQQSHVNFISASMTGMLSGKCHTIKQILSLQVLW